MLRIIAWLLLTAYLITVGLWHPAATPVSTAFAGLAFLIGLVPAYAWAITAGALWWRHHHSRTVVVTETVS
ncbi:hypothetical protein AB0C91_10220 [Streptomyces sp. NPDC048674]|uniref:hypothetical protein n=1 Tax=Streptomyces sp. NPDC048674 TaxID=3155491 RepID=UPI0034213DF6